MRPLITALILLAACTDPKPSTQDPPAMTASPSQAPDQTEQPDGKTLLQQARQQYDGYYKYQAASILPTKPSKAAEKPPRALPSITNRPSESAVFRRPLSFPCRVNIRCCTENACVASGRHTLPERPHRVRGLRHTPYRSGRGRLKNAFQTASALFARPAVRWRNQ